MRIHGDVRFALRLLGRSPVFTLTAVMSLALGVASTTTVFGVIDALLLRPAPGIRDAAAVVDVGRSNLGEGFDNMSHGLYRYLQAHTTTLSGLAAVEFSGGPMSLSSNGASERVQSTLVSASYFAVLGTRPAIGRLFLPDDDAVPDERPVALLSHAFWMRRFAGDPAVLTRPLRLNNRDFTVVGVAEAGFEGLTFVGTDIWVPMSMVAAARGRPSSNLLDDPTATWHMAVGRLEAGVSRAQAEAELNALATAFRAQEPRANPRHRIKVAPTGRVPPPVRLPFTAFLGLLFALTGALLAIACSNVGGMLLARATARRREMATRLAVGAGRRHVIAQLLTETLVLFVIAGLAALPLTFWLVQLLAGSLPALPVPVNLDLTVNLRVIAFALGVAGITAVGFGLAPARLAAAGDLASLLHGAHATPDRRRLRLRHALVVTQVALSLTLVITASLFARTLRNVAAVDPGYRLDDMLLASLDVSLSGYRDQEAVALIERFRHRLEGISGVTAVSSANQIPLQGSSLGLGRLRAPGYQGPRGDEIDADWNVVSPRFFDAVGTRLLEGRDMSPADHSSAPRVAVVNETFARAVWPGRSAVGQRLMHQTRDRVEEVLEVVGVVADAKYRYYTEQPQPFIFVPLAQHPMGQATLFVRHAPGRNLSREIRAAIAQVEAGVPVILLQPFEDAASVGLVPQKLAAWTAGGVGVLGVFLAALGLYGLMAFLVGLRAREMAIRMALGASGRDMQTMVLAHAARLSALGGVAALVLSGIVGRAVQALLVGVAPFDPVAFGGPVLLFGAILAAACWTPVRRAASTDPAAVLRAE